MWLGGYKNDKNGYIAKKKKSGSIQSGRFEDSLKALKIFVRVFKKWQIKSSFLTENEEWLEGEFVFPLKFLDSLPSFNNLQQNIFSQKAMKEGKRRD